MKIRTKLLLIVLLMCLPLLLKPNMATRSARSCSMWRAHRRRWSRRWKGTYWRVWAGPALATSALSSFFGTNVSLIAMMFFAPLMARWAIKFGPAEYFALIVFAFSMLSSLAGGHAVKGFLATLIGLMMSTIDIDVMSGVNRYTFGQLKLLDGLDFVVVVIGFFAVNEVLRLTYQQQDNAQVMATLGRVFVPIREFFSKIGTLLRGSIIGFVVGVLPGAGAAIASFIAYTFERRIANIKEETFAESGDSAGGSQ